MRKAVIEGLPRAAPPKTGKQREQIGVPLSEREARGRGGRYGPR